MTAGRLVAALGRLAAGLVRGARARWADARYARWVERHDRLKEADREAIRVRVGKLRTPPTISVVIPVCDPPVEALRLALESVARQLYPYWELCIADDASEDPRVHQLLERWRRRESRVRLARRPTRGGIAAATNSALELATGEHVAFLDHDDELAEHALYLVAEELRRCPEAELIYSDHDKIDAAGRRSRPYFKPDWSPDLLLCQNYLGHLTVYRRARVREVGGLRSDLDGAQDYDLTLRCLEGVPGERVRHLPWVLYHWRTLPRSTAASLAAKPGAVRAGRAAVNAHLRRQAVAAEVVAAPLPQFHRVLWRLPQPPPEVSLIVLGVFARDLAVQTRALLRRTDYRRLELLVPQEETAGPTWSALQAELSGDRRLRQIDLPAEAGPAAARNRAAQRAGGDLLVFLDPRLRPLQGNWLTELTAEATRPEVGAVGARVQDRLGRVVHGGTILGGRQVVQDAHRGHTVWGSGHFGRARLPGNFSAVSERCLAVRRELFERLGGFDDAELPVHLYAVDFCLRLWDLGYRVVWTPYAGLRAGGAGTRRGGEDWNREEARLRVRWPRALAEDPFYNPNLDLDRGCRFQPAFPPRVRPPWQSEAP